ncbi:hypothetical protein BJX68DRAFT_228346 [Aspergillus pseudodeflectus]|uniref:Uncharacterized protein n=1 Tax=Aspergillus pseudodeflectus TaxID=176178 RepID=A0ABR4L1A1_9EURO
MRRAQEAFRTRQKAAHDAERDLLTKQEAAIGSMTSAFVDFVDFLVRSRSYQMDRNLMRKLHETIRRFMVANDHEQCADGRASTTMHSETTTDQQPLEASGHEDYTSGTDMLSYSTLPGEPNILDYTLGNGWPEHYPVSYTMLDERLKPRVHDASPFVRRLIYHTINFGFQLLNGGTEYPLELAKRVFQFSLLFHSRQELLFNLRWFLGPGSQELVRLAFVPFEGSPTPATEDSVNTTSLVPAVDAYAVNATRINGFDNAAAAPFVNAQEVELYLHEKGAHFLDGDTIEVPLPESPPTTDEILQPSTFTYHGQTEQICAYDNLKYRLRTSLLIENLIYISVCLSKGPAYRRHDLDHAIFLSTIDMVSKTPGPPEYGTIPWAGVL